MNIVTFRRQAIVHELALPRPAAPNVLRNLFTQKSAEQHLIVRDMLKGLILTRRRR